MSSRKIYIINGTNIMFRMRCRNVRIRNSKYRMYCMPSRNICNIIRNSNLY